MNIKNFKHCTQIKVRNYEIDWQGIVHNANYLLYFEIARVQYFHDIGAGLDEKSVNTNAKIVLVRHEINYKTSARFGDTLNVYSRISAIKNTSFICEGMMENTKTKTLVAENVAFHVWLNPQTDKSLRVPDEFRKSIQKYEGDNCVIEWGKIEA